MVGMIGFSKASPERFGESKVADALNIGQESQSTSRRIERRTLLGPKNPAIDAQNWAEPEQER